MKQKWIKPQLRILVRNQPEESILITCKDFGNPSGMHGRDNACYNNLGCGAGLCSNFGAT